VHVVFGSLHQKLNGEQFYNTEFFMLVSYSSIRNATWSDTLFCKNES